MVTIAFAGPLMGSSQAQARWRQDERTPTIEASRGAVTSMAKLDTDDICERYGPIVYRRALGILGDPHAAQDATQDVMIKVLKRIQSFRGEAKISTWLYRVTTNHCLNQIRNRTRREELKEIHLPSDDAFTPGMDAMLTVRELLVDADEREARVIIYVYLDGMRREEVAEVMNISVRTVGNLISQFTAWARERLQREGLNPQEVADG